MIDPTQDAVLEPKSKRFVVVQALLAAAGIVFIALALRRSLADGWRESIPSWPSFLLAQPLILAGVFCSAASWRALFGDLRSTPGLMRGFFIAGLARYVPGGVWQAVSQIGSAGHLGIPKQRAVAAFPVHAIVLLVSGALTGTGIALTSELQSWVRIGGAAGVVPLVLLSRRWMAVSLAFLRRVTRRVPAPEDLPDQVSILRSFAWNLGSVVLAAAAFAILTAGAMGSAFAYAAAWTIGYALVPVPSGLGVREAVLIALSALPTAVVLAASVAHRVSTMIWELVICVGVVVTGALSRRGVRTG